MGSFSKQTSNNTTPTLSGDSTLDKLHKDDKAMMLVLNAHIIPTGLPVVLGFILKAFKICIAKSTLAALHNIKDGRNALRMG
ncbi:hypothetical protein LTR12_017812 [Friedmanniomyces endolithicus]|nr:hypothetical protein LTR12_017812 [Friedmanniomyces endolithicus]